MRVKIRRRLFSNVVVASIAALSWSLGLAQSGNGSFNGTTGSNEPACVNNQPLFGQSLVAGLPQGGWSCGYVSYTFHANVTQNATITLTPGSGYNWAFGTSVIPGMVAWFGDCGNPADWSDSGNVVVDNGTLYEGSTNFPVTVTVPVTAGNTYCLWVGVGTYDLGVSTTFPTGPFGVSYSGFPPPPPPVPIPLWVDVCFLVAFWWIASGRFRRGAYAT